MPHPTAVLEAFHLKKGESIVHNDYIFRLNKVNILHRVVEPYKKYMFPLTLEIVSSSPDKVNVLKAFSDYCATARVVMSEYGNPYHCYWNDWTITSLNTLLPGPPHSYIIKGMGHADRIFSSSQKVALDGKN